MLGSMLDMSPTSTKYGDNMVNTHRIIDALARKRQIGPAIWLIWLNLLGV
jgi:hypothetical protein